MYTAETIAKYVINWANDNSVRITNLKLQKLLYFIQVEFFGRTGKRLIKDDFYAKQLGPVIPDVYNTFSVYAAFHIPKQNCTDAVTFFDSKLIDLILQKYALMSVWDLVELSQKQDPWKYNYQIFGDNTIIPYESIVCYVKGVKEELK